MSVRTGDWRAIHWQPMYAEKCDAENCGNDASWIITVAQIEAKMCALCYRAFCADADSI